MSVLLGRAAGTNQIIVKNLGRCIKKGGTLEEEIATDRKFEFIQVLQRKLIESSETIRVGKYNGRNIKYGCRLTSTKLALM